MYLSYTLINPVTNFWTKRPERICSEASKTQLVKLNVQQALELFLYLRSIIWYLFQTSIHSKYTFTLTLELKNYDLEADLRKRSTFSLIELVASVM